MNIPGLKYSVPMLSGWGFLVVVVSFLVVGCTKANPSATCSDGTCTDPNFAYCDADGSVGGVPGDCVAVSCTPGEIKECRGDGAFTCSASGNGYELVACELGCSETPAPHCKYIQPHYMPNVCDVAASVATLGVSSSGSFDPNLDSNCTGGIIAQTGAPAICVVHYGTIKVEEGSVLEVLGTKTHLGRAIAFVADFDLTVSGILDVSAHGGFNGPGGGSLISGADPDATVGTHTEHGGGGAGGATPGAAGGNPTDDGGAANGGMQQNNPALSALIGGASIPTCCADSEEFPFLGGGGGAISLVSCHGSVSIDGVVGSGGGGGSGGQNGLGFPFGGYAGGAGGLVDIEAVAVTVTGSLFANGGAGGGGGQASVVGNNGEDGQLSDTRPAFGGMSVNGTGAGGQGGYGSQPPHVGTHPTMPGTTAGGGGGSVGFLQTYTPMDVPPTLTPSHVSPPLQPNGIVETR